MRNLKERQDVLNDNPFVGQRIQHQPSFIKCEIFPLTLDSRHLFDINYPEIEQSKLVNSIREHYANLSQIMQFEVEDLLQQLSKGEIS